MIKKLFRQMLATQIVSAMTVTICMLIDIIMIGRFLGVPSMSAYGFATPILLVFAAVGSMISAGIQVMCGQTMGVGDKKGTYACYTISVIAAATVSIVGTAAVIIFTNPICTMLGAGEPGPDNEVFGLTRDYLRGFIIGAPAFIMAQIMVPYMQMSGSRARLVAAVIAMTVGDIVLDILNVKVFHWGTFGMGLASSLSYYIAAIIGIIYFFKKDCIFKFRLNLFSLKRCIQLLHDGIPTLVNQISLVFLTLLLNFLLRQTGGEVAVAAYSVISTVGNLCYSFSTGIAAVALTLATILYVDSDKSGLKQLVDTMVFYSITICSVVTVVFIIAAKWLVPLFTEDAEAGRIAVSGLKLFVLSLVPCALNTSFKNYYQGINHVSHTMVISFFQNFLFTGISSFVLSRFLSVKGVWLGFVCGELLTFIFISIYATIKNKKSEFGLMAYSLLDSDFGIPDEDVFESSVECAEDILTASQEASDFCKKKGISSKVRMLISLCIEEMSNNIVKHGFKGRKDHNIDIKVMIRDGSPTLRIRDNCAKFDPVKYVKMQNEEDAVAHIGLRMVMKLVKEANYVNSLGLNNLTLKL
ncbi:MAG TPA: hypothetical protein DCG30_03445 [Ruminococcus sp.]|nr:hypothetical protein [Ruminococcus sp.]